MDYMKRWIGTAAALLLCLSAFAGEAYDPTRWEDTIANFETAARNAPPEAGGILFLGSSSIRMWDLTLYYPNKNVINRGFGGSHIEDSLHYFGRLVTPLEPSAIVFYAGDNDIAWGKSPERVLEDYQAFAGKVMDRLPDTQLVFIEIKPSIARWDKGESMRAANRMIAEWSKEHPQLHVLNIDNPMLGDDGRPREELFLGDGLHLNKQGYDLWTRLLNEKMASVMENWNAGPIPERVLASGFDSDAWIGEWGLDRAPRNTDIVYEWDEWGFEPLNKDATPALRIKVNEGDHYGTSFSYIFRNQLGREPETVWFDYAIRLGSDWDPERGGKLPGFGGTYGRAGWGGRPVDGTDGWSARGLFNGQRDGFTPIGFYCYHADMRGQYGSGWVWNEGGFKGLENNRWYRIRQYVRMNTPGDNDGVLRAWVDGKPVYENPSVRMRDVESLKVETVWMNVYLGGTWSSKSDHHLYVDNVTIHVGD